MIYALLGLASCPQSITVDYAKSVRDVYVEATKAMIADISNSKDDSKPSLNIICLAYRTLNSSQLALPSWVPDFSAKQELLEPFSHVLMNHCAGEKGEGYNTIEDGGVLQNIAAIDDLDRLTVSAVIIAEITTVNGAIEGVPGNGSHRTWEPPNLDSTVYLPTGEQAIDAFWRTLLLDEGQFTGKRLLAEELKSFREEYLIWSGRKKRSAWINLTTRHKRVLSVFDMLQDSLRGLTFGISDKGYWGMIPQVSKVGDLICAARGLSVPVVLRKVEENSFTLVGPCYIHGIMDGEIAKAVEAGTQQEKLITIA